MIKKITISIVAISALVSSAVATDFKPLGFKATGMGGTGVASMRGAYATYYNPAFLAFGDYSTEFALGIGVSLSEKGLADNIDALADLEFNDTLDDMSDYFDNLSAANINPDGTINATGSEGTIVEAIDILKNMASGNGVQIAPAASFAAQLPNNLGIGLYAQAVIQANAVIDQNRMDLIFEVENLPNSSFGSGKEYVKYDDNDNVYRLTNEDDYNNNSLYKNIDDGHTYLNAIVALTYSYPIGYAHLFETKYGLLSVGGNFKPMKVESYSTRLDIDTESDEISDELDQSKRTSNAATIDLGLFFQEKTSGVNFGFVGKNLTSPSFKLGGDQGGTLKYKPAYRAGASYRTFNDMLEVAFDIDLNEQKSPLRGFDTQYTGVGLELSPTSWLAFRGGLMKNIASDSIDEGLIYSTGLGFGLKWLQMDMSYMMSSKKGNFDGSSIPRYTHFNFSFISRW